MNFENKPPEWQNEGTEPTDEIKKIGFQAGYKPPAAYFNWFWSKVSKCINELQQKFMDAPTPLVGICNSVKGNSSKIVECSDFRLYDGARILVTFANGNSANYMTLNVNNTGAVMVWFPVGQNRIYNDPIITKIIAGGGAYEFVYQGGSSPKWMYCGATDIPVDDAIATFTEATECENINSGETTSTIFGKIKKWFTDLKTVAFTGSYNDLSDKPTSMVNPNSLTLTMNGSATTYNGSSTLSKTWYAPTTSGTTGYELVSSGTNNAPVWKAPSYAVCSTSGETQTKTVSITNFKLVVGARVTIKFTYAHKSIRYKAYLNVNSTGSKPIKYYGQDVVSYQGYPSTSSAILAYANTWEDGEIVEFIYDGTNWVSIPQKHVLDPMCVNVIKRHWYSFTSVEEFFPKYSNVARIGDFFCGEDCTSTLQSALNSTAVCGKVRLLSLSNEPTWFIDDELFIGGAISSDTSEKPPKIVTIEGTSKQRTALWFKEGGIIKTIKSDISDDDDYILTLKDLRIHYDPQYSGLSNNHSIIDLGRNSGEGKTVIVLENVDIEMKGKGFGEEPPLRANKIILKNCNFIMEADGETEYLCHAGLNCDELEVEGGSITLKNNTTNTISGSSFELNFVYNSDVVGYIRCCTINLGGSYRATLSDGQLDIDRCTVNLQNGKASLNHYTTDVERRNSVLRDSIINYTATTYLTFGKIISCNFNNTITTGYGTDSYKLQILCPSQIMANNFKGRSDMNFNSNKVVFVGNVLQYEQTNTDFPPGSEHANNLVLG